MFLYELGEVGEESLSPKKEAEIAVSLQKLLEPVHEMMATTEEEAYLRELVGKFTLSVTALNAYLQCPYRFKLNNLIKVPRAKEPHMAFGTAVHGALEAFYKELKENGMRPPLDFLLAAFELALKKEVLTLDEERNRLDQGNKILTAYYELYKDEFREPLFLEKFERVLMDDIPLNGKIDRIDWHDESERSVKVVDYKTGSVKTVGQIMGTTQDSTGDLHRQLVFYKLLLELDKRLKLKFGAAELDFVQSPADKGKSGKMKFLITNDEVAELKEVIRKVIGDIRALRFPRTHDLGNCEGCDFAAHCYPNGLPLQSS
jgi:DNA helicase-2/ATP-dependent DNA helicase PcrA